MGETTAGLLGGVPQIVGITQVAGRPPYPEVMLESLVRDTGDLGADFLLAAGDISAEAVPGDLSKAGQLLQRFGKYQRDYFVTARQPRPRRTRGIRGPTAARDSGKATTASRTSSSRATNPATSRAS